MLSILPLCAFDILLNCGKNCRIVDVVFCPLIVDKNAQLIICSNRQQCSYV